MNINNTKIIKLLVVVFLNVTNLYGSERNAMNIKEVWHEYIVYWKEIEPDMTDPESCEPETIKNIEMLEKQLQIRLPEDFKKSLQLVNHSTKKCDGYAHSWFGSSTGIELFLIKSIIESHTDLSANCEINDESLINKYFGNVKHYKDSKLWPKEWIPISWHNGVYFCLDLRKDIGDQYGQVLAVYPNVSLGIRGDEWYNYIVWIAPNFTEFMKKMLDDIKIEHGLTDDYFRKLMHLPDNYADDSWGV